jgi:citronellol/citronellal dehydrogenase
MASKSERVALITGSSRGIGRALALGLAADGWRIVVAAKSVESTERLPGSIHTVAAEIAAAGGEALPVQIDVRDDTQIENMTAAALERFGRIDLLINNAGALFWQQLSDTPAKKFDLVMAVNARAACLCARAVLPHMIRQGGGHIINMSPPLDLKFVPGRIAYCISKMGMTLLTIGLAEEVREHKIAVNSLWPSGMIESQATINWRLGDRSQWRKPEILLDCVRLIVKIPPPTFTGQVLIDEDFLRTQGVTDFSGYACVPAGQPG